MARAKIDWNEVRRKLEESRTALERSTLDDPGRREAVYRRRAAHLAKPASASLPAQAALAVMVFDLGGDRFGIEISELADAAPLARCIPVPGSRPELLGLMNCRGEVRAVVDLAKLLGLPGEAGEAAGYALFLRVPAGVAVGLRVDRLDQVRRVSPEEISIAASPGQEFPARFLRGVTADSVRLLDARALRSHPVLEEVSAP